MKTRTQKRPKSQLLGILRLFFILVLLAAAIWFVSHRALQMETITDEGMYPTLTTGDQVLIDKISYHLLSINRYDQIFFPSSYQENVYYVRRVIGLPGETVQILNGAIYINGKVLEEDYGTGSLTRAGTASTQITLGQHEYFVLGDNREQSIDSRDPSIGNITSDRILGRVVWAHHK